MFDRHGRLVIQMGEWYECVGFVFVFLGILGFMAGIVVQKDWVMFLSAAVTIIAIVPACWNMD